MRRARKSSGYAVTFSGANSKSSPSRAIVSTSGPASNRWPLTRAGGWAASHTQARPSRTGSVQLARSSAGARSCSAQVTRVGLMRAPGPIVLTAMLWARASRESAFTKPSTPCLTAQYAISSR